MFKFNFLDNSNETKETTSKSTKQWREAEEIIPKTLQLTDEQQEFGIVEHKYGDITIKSFLESDILHYLKANEEDSNCILQAEFDHSDLVTAEYEGGLKIWECTIDLINYLNEQNINFKDKKVLDLGCGCGVLGIYTLLKGAVIDFQDYNREVIENITIPNVILNCDGDESKIKKCNFYAGDWKSLINCLKENKYDYILTSETIYNPENYQKLLEVFMEKLDSNGNVLLAAKGYYFGVGGGTRLFETHLEETKSLQSTVIWKCTEGLQREILQIKKI